MISAIALVTDSAGDPPERARETVVRSLAWLVPAVVAGVVRDVVAACPPAWEVEDIMDHAGCALVRAEGEADRLSAAAALVKCARVLVVRIGHQPEGPLAAEMDGFERGAPVEGNALVLLAPSRLSERLFPDRAPAVGLLLDREQLRGAPTSFAQLARHSRNGRRLRTRMVPVL